MNTTSENKNISSILFGKARRAVLSLLYGHSDESFYLRQIVRMTGMGLGPVQRELKQLTDVGIIRRSVQGRQVYYQVNRENPIYNELHGLIVKTAGVADVLRSALAPASEKIKIAFIFGSVASGDERRTSDIDLMIIGSIAFEDVVSLVSPGEEKLGREVNPVVYSITEFKQKIRDNHHFLNTVLDGDKIFLIGDEGELTKLVGNRTVKSP